jgi:flavin reductase (DIM6/NTAB) family NADH-FMN oxidoreductase RutF
MSPPVDKDVFRDVIGHFATGVSVITARVEETDYGVTVSAVCSVSLEPPMLLVCLNRSSRTQGAVSRAGSFVMNVLGREQSEIARRFASARDDKFEGIGVFHGTLGHPFLVEALAHVECGVVEQATGGTHTIFIAEVVHAERFEGEPLLYFRGQFGSLDAGETAGSPREPPSR